jgi:hypothetical protein
VDEIMHTNAKFEHAQHGIATLATAVQVVCVHASINLGQCIPRMALNLT